VTVLTGRWAVARLGPDARVPDWANVPSRLTAIVRTVEELSIVVPEEQLPDDVPAQRGYRLLKVQGPIPFESIGIIAALATPLATAGISIFTVSTYDTDYLMVKDEALTRAVDALRLAGWQVNRAPRPTPTKITSP
jgi:uncharacterized protein